MKFIKMEISITEEMAVIKSEDLRFGYLNTVCHKSMLAAAMLKISVQLSRSGTQVIFRMK